MVDKFSIFISWVDCISRLKSKTHFCAFKKYFHSSELIFPQTLFLLPNKKFQKLSKTPEVQQVIHAGFTTFSTARSSLDTLLNCHMSPHSGIPGWPFFSINFRPLCYGIQRTSLLPKGWVRAPTCILFPSFPSFFPALPLIALVS